MTSTVYRATNTGPARWFRTDPVTLIRQVRLGQATEFIVWIIARPLPEAEEWHWKFTSSSSVYDGRTTAQPEQVYLSASGDKALLNITNATRRHSGYYNIWTSNKYGGWKERDLRFTLMIIDDRECNYVLPTTH